MARRSQADDLDAWVLATAPRATAYARSLVRDAHQAEDVVQDCYCRLLQKQDVYDLPRDGLKLLLTAITNASINLTTRRKPTASLSVGDDQGAGVPEPAQKRFGRPDEQAELNELEVALAEALEKLPPMQRAAVELKSWGYSQQEIAEMLSLGASNAGVLIHRARHTLAELLESFLGDRKV